MSEDQLRAENKYLRGQVKLLKRQLEYCHTQQKVLWTAAVKVRKRLPNGMTGFDDTAFARSTLDEALDYVVRLIRESAELDKDYRRKRTADLKRLKVKP